MAEMLTYEQTLTSTTGGRGSYHMEFSHYDEVPGPPARRRSSRRRRPSAARRRKRKSKPAAKLWTLAQWVPHVLRQSRGALPGRWPWALACALEPRTLPAAPAAPSFDDWLAGCAPRRSAAASARRPSTRRSTGVEPDAGRRRARSRAARARPEPRRTTLTQLADATHGRRRAAKMLEKHAELLQRVESAYGIPPAVMVSVWGLESNFGPFTAAIRRSRRSPRWPTIRAAAAVSQRALRGADDSRHGQHDARWLKGSWAGAMGQPQFMPSSYLNHAVDFDGDGRADIWTIHADVFALDGELSEERRVGRRRALGPRSAALAGDDGQDRARGADAHRRLRGVPRDDGGAPLASGRCRRHAAPAARQLPTAAISTASLVRGQTPAFPRLPELRRAARIQLLEQLRHRSWPAG